MAVQRRGRVVKNVHGSRGRRFFPLRFLLAPQASSGASQDHARLLWPLAHGTIPQELELLANIIQLRRPIFQLAQKRACPLAHGVQQMRMALGTKALSPPKEQEPHT